MAHRKLKAFTLIEMIVVIAIIAITSVGLLEMVRNASYANTASNAAKATLNLIRTTKHQSMLIRRSTSTAWVFGVGLRYKKLNKDQWEISRVRYVDSAVGGIFELYRPYPTTVPTDDQIEEFESGGNYDLQDRLILDQHITLKWLDQNKNLYDCVEYYEIFETLTGFPHWYCKNADDAWSETTSLTDTIYLLFKPSHSTVVVKADGDIYMAPSDILNIPY